MSRRIAAAVVLLLVLAVLAILLPLLQRTRMNAALAASQNNLRELSLFAAHHAKPEQQDGALLLNFIPAATVFLPGVPSENRLSWIAPVLPGLNQKRQDIVSLLAQIDDTQPWTAERNQTAGRTVLVAALCPENTPQGAGRFAGCLRVMFVHGWPRNRCCDTSPSQKCSTFATGRCLPLRRADSLRPDSRRAE